MSIQTIPDFIHVHEIRSVIGTDETPTFRPSDNPISPWHRVYTNSNHWRQIPTIRNYVPTSGCPNTILVKSLRRQ